MINTAIQVALEAHKKQLRKGTKIPYITHPLSVGIILAKAGFSDDVIAAGILHDTVEDTPVTLNDLREKFGEEVAEIVDRVSEPDKSLSWEERKQHALDSLNETSEAVRFVTLADKLDNIRAIAGDYKTEGDGIWKRFKRGRESQKWYYRCLLNALHDGPFDDAYSFLYNQLAQTVTEVFGEDD